MGSKKFFLLDFKNKFSFVKPVIKMLICFFLSYFYKPPNFCEKGKPINPLICSTSISPFPPPPEPTPYFEVETQKKKLLLLMKFS